MSEQQKTGISLAFAKVHYFLRMESFAGFLLILFSVFALLLANSPWHYQYQQFLDFKLSLGYQSFQLSKPVILWINDALMAVFFLLIGLELKREILEGQLSNKSQVILPGLAALGGVIFPAVIYFLLNYQNKTGLAGWAIPMATDIAFALGVLTLLGKRVPSALKLFLLTLAIFDDLAAIIVIALFYTKTLSLWALVMAGVVISLLAAANRLKVATLFIYLPLGMLLWFFVLKSGVHATIAGVVFAMLIPLNVTPSAHSPLKFLENKLHAAVTYFILPLFAFANSGINFDGVTWAQLMNSVSLGVALGLFFGKQFGVFLFSYLTIKLKLAKLPQDTSWRQLYAVSIICGIGFTMSLFICALAFESAPMEYNIDGRIGVMLGTLISAIVGYIAMVCACAHSKKPK
ncbi:Na+/H+ antiporter NhaA [Candidatus Berkiella aquae]|uniref:Na(+)/H(+) antiporter NhaA n=1 Tax=Candidatus Berkiella aquae TaxID=295108 RepID=A0A0Q9YGT4_9GAMM|nr:Na+/H+ antiporter NhaA [Candidatus Berkiella aquae]MCS5710836.1 Na+/H+ antiporter NhaA [Candidatus Berkiella aquae]